MRILKFVTAIVAFVALAMATLMPGATAKPEFSKKEKKACTYCHTSKNPKEYSEKDLTDAGKYYKEKKTLEGYVKK